MNRWHWASLLLAVCLSGCASLPGATTDTVDGRTVEYVQAALDATGQRVASLPVDPSVPVFVLSALQTPGASSALAEEVRQKRADFAHLYPGSTQVLVDSGHGIPLEKPEAVVSAIRAALQAARALR